MAVVCRFSMPIKRSTDAWETPPLLNVWALVDSWLHALLQRVSANIMVAVISVIGIVVIIMNFMFHLLAPPPCRAGPSPWLALWYGMVSYWLSVEADRNQFMHIWP